MKITKNYLKKLIQEEVSLEKRKRAALQEIKQISELDEGFGDTLAKFAGQKLGIGPAWAKHPKKFGSEAEYKKYLADLKAKLDADKEAYDQEMSGYEARRAEMERENEREAAARAERDAASRREYDDQLRSAQRERDTEEFYKGIKPSTDRYSRYNTERSD
jgi:hypothetical protein